MPHPVARVWALVREQKKDITAIYFYAILSGLIQLSVPLGVQAIIGFVLAGAMSTSLVVLITVLIVAVLLAGIMQINQMKIIERIQQVIFVQYAYAFAERIPQLDLKAVDRYHLPELTNRFFDTASLQKSISKLLLDLPAASIQILFGLLLLSFYHPFFIFFGILLLLALWLILYTSGTKGLESSIEESNYKYGLAGWLEEMARLVKSFKFSSSTGLHLQKADERATGYIKSRTTHFRVLLLQYKTLIAFKVAITAAMLIVGVTLLLNQQLNIGQFVAAEIIIIAVVNAVEKIIINLDSVYDVLTAVEKVNHLIDKPIEQTGTYLLQTNNPISIEASNLTFEYEAGKPILQNISFSILPGSKVCITGSDGSGKSTLLKLLIGVYKQFSGSLLINNIPLGNYNLESLRERMGILFQNENVFNGTLWENISMGRQNIDQDYVSELCRRTGLNHMLATLPNGFDTQLDPMGKRLPENVVQKIMLVRALAHKPLLLIMEEPSQGIEEQLKQDLQKLLLQLQNTTVIVATNDDSFARQSDQVISLRRSRRG